MDPSITWTLLLRTYIVGGVWGLLGLHRRLVDSTGLEENPKQGQYFAGFEDEEDITVKLLQMVGH